MQKQILEKIHCGHQGIQKCRLRVNSSVWWPGVSRQVEDYIKACPTCIVAAQETQETPSHNTHSRTGTIVGPPDCLNYWRKGDVA